MTVVTRPDTDSRAGARHGFPGRYRREYADVCDVAQAGCAPYGAR